MYGADQAQSLKNLYTQRRRFWHTPAVPSEFFYFFCVRIASSCASSFRSCDDGDNRILINPTPPFAFSPNPFPPASGGSCWLGSRHSVALTQPSSRRSRLCRFTATQRSSRQSKLDGTTTPTTPPPPPPSTSTSTTTAAAGRTSNSLPLLLARRLRLSLSLSRGIAHRQLFLYHLADSVPASDVGALFLRPFLLPFASPHGGTFCFGTTHKKREPRPRNAPSLANPRFSTMMPAQSCPPFD